MYVNAKIQEILRMANYIINNRKNKEMTGNNTTASSSSSTQKPSTSSTEPHAHPTTKTSDDGQMAGIDDVFEKMFDDSMNNLETAAGEGDGYETDSESNTSSVSSAESASSVQILIENMPPKYSDKLNYVGSSSSDEESEPIITAINKSPNLIPTDTKNSEIFVFRPYLQPFQERRRLSQCKEEEEEDPGGSSQAFSHEKSLPTPPPPIALSDSPMDVGKFKELEKLRQQFMEKLESNLKLDTPKNKKEKKSQPLQKCLEAKEEGFTVIKGKFTITKTKATETPEVNRLRKEADNLRKATASSNAHTISFPCRSGGYSSVKGLFDSPFKGFTPHLDRKFFDTSLVEIRQDCGGDDSLIEKKSSGRILDEVWIKRRITPPSRDSLDGKTTDDDVSILKI